MEKIGLQTYNCKTLCKYIKNWETPLQRGGRAAPEGRGGDGWGRGFQTIREAPHKQGAWWRHSEVYLLYCKFLYLFQMRVPLFYNDKFYFVFLPHSDISDRTLNCEAGVRWFFFFYVILNNFIIIIMFN